MSGWVGRGGRDKSTCLVHEEAEVRLRERLLALDDPVQVRVQQLFEGLGRLDGFFEHTSMTVSYHPSQTSTPIHTSITMYSSSAGAASPVAPGAGGAPAVRAPLPAAAGASSPEELSRRNRSFSVMMFWCWPRYLFACVCMVGGGWTSQGGAQWWVWLPRFISIYTYARTASCGSPAARAWRR